MNPMTASKQQLREKFKQLTHHPYFGFLVVGMMLLVLFVLYTNGSIPLTTMRALGKTTIYVVIALGFSILLGYAGLASLGTAGFVGVGTYLLGYLTKSYQWSSLTILIVTILGAIVIGLVVGFISLRIEGMYLAIITLGLSEILNEVFKNATAITNGTNGLGIDNLFFFGQTINISIQSIFSVLVFALVLIMVLTYNIIQSPTGRAMLSMKNSESAAQAMGVSILQYRLLAFIIASVYAFIGGFLYMAFYGFTIPTSWTLGFSLNILAAVIVGGSRSIYGIMLGTFMIFGLDEMVFKNIVVYPSAFAQRLMTSYPEAAQSIESTLKYIQGILPHMTYILGGVLIIVVIMFYPGGLIQLVTTLGKKIQKLISSIKKKVRVMIYGEDQ